jgi:hypothetical protein
MQPAMGDPLGAVEVTARLLQKANAMGLETRISSDFHEFASLRKQLRGKPVSPMFDPVAGCLTPERAFWMGSYAEGKCVAVMAFRLDHVEPNLASWALGWMVGLYMRRGELIVPSHITPPGGTRAEKLSGPLCYQGEAWIDPKALRSRDAVETLPLLGTMLAYIKWQPNAFWAIGSGNMATRGVYVRMHYPTVERSFLRWEWLPEGADPVEWLGIAERADMEFNIQERLAAEEPPPAPILQIRRISTSDSTDMTETPLLPSGKRVGSTTR